MSEQVQTNGLEDQAPSISDFQVTVNGEAFTLGQLASSTAAAQLLYIAFQQQTDQAEADKRAAVQEVEEKNIVLKAQKEELQAKYDKALDDGIEISKEIAELKLQVKDAESKRDAAAEALKEAQAELEQVKSHRDDLQKQIAVGVRGAIKVDAVEALAQYKAERKKEEESKPAIYDVHKISSTHSSAILAKTGEPFEFVTNYIGQYRVIKPEEVETELARFRAEQDQASAADVQADNHADSALVEPIAPPQLEGGTFQGDSMEDVHATAGLVKAEPSVEGNGTVEERLAALEARVNTLEKINAEKALNQA